MLQTNTKSPLFSVSRKDLIVMIIVVICMFGARFIPVPESWIVTSYGVQVLAIFFGLVIGWCISSLFWPSVLAIVALALTPYGDSSAVISGAFSNSTILMVLLGFICFAPMAYSGVGNVLCNKLLSLKFFVGKPYLLVFTLMMGLFLLSGINALPAPLLLAVITLLGELCQSAGYKSGEKFPAFFLMGIMLIVCCGRSMLPFMPWAIETLSPMEPLQDLSYLTYVVMIIPGSVMVALLYILVMKLVGCDFSRLKASGFSIEEEDKKMNDYQKGVFALIMFIVALLILVGFYGSADGNIVQQLLNKIGVIGVNAFGIFLGIILKAGNEPILNMKKAYESSSIPIDVILMVAMAILISNILTADGTGIKEGLTLVLAPFLERCSGYVLALIVALVTFVLTNMANNMVVAYTMVAVLQSIFSIDPTINLTVTGSMITFTAITGILLPSASFYGAIIYGNEMVTSKMALFSGACAMIVTIIVIAVYMIPIGLLV